MHQQTGSALVQVNGCCIFWASHYLANADLLSTGPEIWIKIQSLFLTNKCCKCNLKNCGHLSRSLCVHLRTVYFFINLFLRRAIFKISMTYSHGISNDLIQSATNGFLTSKWQITSIIRNMFPVFSAILSWQTVVWCVDSSKHGCWEEINGS